MQIKQAVATGAVSLAAVGGVLVAVSVGIQGIAKAEIPQYAAPGSTTNKSCAVGTIGVFQSTYTPECANLPGAPFQSSTAEYWPLFPAQNRYGMQFVQYGLGKTPFTTCNEYMPESILTVEAAAVQLVDEQLSGAVNMFFNMCFDNVPLFMNAALLNMGFNMTDFSSSDFAAIQASCTGTDFESLDDLVQNTCNKNGTTADCVKALNLVVIKGSTDFTQPIGGVYSDMNDMLQNFAGVAGDMPQTEDLAMALVAISGLVLGCDASNATNVPACVQASIPTQITGTNYPLTGAVKFVESGDLLEFMQSVVDLPASFIPASFKPLFEQLLVIAKDVVLCNSTGFTNDAKVCLARTAGYDAAIQVFNGFYPYLKFPARSSTSIPDSGLLTSQVIQQCQNGSDDLAVIGTSQKLVISALFFVFFGVVVAVPVLVSRKLQWLIAPASTVILSAVLLVVGLLNLYGAPVYKTLGLSCNPTKMCYSTEASIPLALAAVVLMLVSSVTLLVLGFSALCNRREPKTESCELKETSVPSPAALC